MLDNVLELRLLLTTLTPKTGAYYWLDVASEDFKRVMIYTTFEEIATHYSFAVLMSRILLFQHWERCPILHWNCSQKCSAICVLVASQTPFLEEIYSTKFFCAANLAGFPATRHRNPTVIIFGMPSHPSSWSTPNSRSTWP